MASQLEDFRWFWFILLDDFDSSWETRKTRTFLTAPGSAAEGKTFSDLLFEEKQAGSDSCFYRTFKTNKETNKRISEMRKMYLTSHLDCGISPPVKVVPEEWILGTNLCGSWSLDLHRKLQRLRRKTSTSVCSLWLLLQFGEQTWETGKTWTQTDETFHSNGFRFLVLF